MWDIHERSDWIARVTAWGITGDFPTSDPLQRAINEARRNNWRYVVWSPFNGYVAANWDMQETIGTGREIVWDASHQQHGCAGNTI